MSKQTHSFLQLTALADGWLGAQVQYCWSVGGAVLSGGQTNCCTMCDKLSYWRPNCSTAVFVWWENCRQVWVYSSTLNTVLCATVGVAFPLHLAPVKINELTYSACVILVYVPVTLLPKSVTEMLIVYDQHAMNYKMQIVMYVPTAVDATSTRTVLGTYFPNLVSLKNVLKQSSPTPSILWSESFRPSGWIPCSRQCSSQNAPPVCTPAWPTWMEIHSRWNTQILHTCHSSITN